MTMQYELSNLVEAIKIIYVLGFLLVFSIQDYRRREISDNLVYVFTGGSIVFCSLTIYMYKPPPLYLAFSFMVPALFIAMYLAGLMGEGDVYVVFSLALLYPVPPHSSLLPGSLLPPSLSITVYSTLSIVLVSLLYGVYTLIRYRSLLKEVPLKYRFIYPFIAKPMRLNEYLATEFYYPLTLIELKDNGVKTTYRLHYDVEEEDPRAYREMFKRLIESDVVPDTTYVWVSYGIPYIIPLFLGTIIFLLVGDAPILRLLELIL